MEPSPAAAMHFPDVFAQPEQPVSAGNANVVVLVRIGFHSRPQHPAGARFATDETGRLPMFSLMHVMTVVSINRVEVPGVFQIT